VVCNARVRVGEFIGEKWEVVAGDGRPKAPTIA